MQRRDCLRGFAALAALGFVSCMPGVAGAGPLAKNRVRDLRHGVWLDSATLFERLARAPAIVVGERHDNPEHHRLERWLIARLAERGILGGVAMEMLDTQQQVRLERISRERLLSLSDAELRRVLDWQRSGWDWSAYEPILRLVLRLGVPLGAANLTHERIGEIVNAGQAPDLPPAVAVAQRHALIEGHCGLL
ncbi:MAG TPA: ChaN family lipoprotein, partial [Modicisalibacter sp.]|nr:ChaN family lipoprotein [Modicisalibacter sp.]